MNVVSEKISKRLYELNMTNAELARILKVNKNAVGNWVNGICAPNHTRIAEVCKALGVDPNYLYNWEGENGSK